MYLELGHGINTRGPKIGDGHEFGPHGPHLGSPREQDTNHGRGTAVQHTWLIPEVSDPVPRGGPGLGDAARFQHRFGILTETYTHTEEYFASD